jgi:predicted ATPase
MPADALDFITVRGFKSIAAIEKLRLNPINILIGANGSGKSNFIDIFALLNAMERDNLHQYVQQAGGAEKILHFGSKTTKTLQIYLSFFEPGNDYHLRLSPTPGDDLYVTSQGVSTVNRYPTLEALRGAAPIEAKALDKPFGAEEVRSRLSGWRIYHFHDTGATSPMRKTAKLDDNRFFRTDGSNLPAFLYLLQQQYPDSYRLIRHTIQSVAPFFDDFSLAPRNLAPDTMKLEWKHKNSEQYFDASDLSDGTLRFIALATLFLQPVSFLPSTILVDEPELGLHPFAIEKLASMIRYASKAAQIIVSTQSSLLIDYFDPEDILVANRVDGATQIERLDSAELKEWLADYSLGQLWEKGELTARPVPESDGAAIHSR